MYVIKAKILIIIMQRHQIQPLIKKYNAGNCTDAEKALVEDWYLQFEQKDLTDLSYQEREADLDKIWARLPVHHTNTKSIKIWYRIAAAAVILIFLTVGAYMIKQQYPDQEVVMQTLNRTTKPGGNNAVITLSDGRQIALTDADNGQLAVQNDITITKTANGKVVYKPGTAAGNKLVYNTLTTPLGGTYSLTLADGTNVILDAGSSIRYPVAFNGSERRVEITGQAYFEVAHNKAKPFRVSSNGQMVEVLGTHFNINAYHDEGSTKTTLTEGSIKITTDAKVALLKPGQQATTSSGTTAINVKGADVETALAWKNGIFRFKRADLQTVMRQFARWYNVEVVYEGEIPEAAITGKVQRTANAGQIIKILNDLGIRFKVDGRKIIILQK
jgi:transmembrane sensor